MYGKIENGKVVRILHSKPDWRYDDGSIITDKDLALEGIYKIDPIVKDGYNINKEMLIKSDINDLIINEETKTITNFYKVISISLDDIYKNACISLLESKNSLLYNNMSYNFSDGRKGIIQLRNDNDFSNIENLFIDASYSISQNENKNYIFVDEANIKHTMTAQELSEMCHVVKTHHENILNKYWNVKHNELDVIYNDISLTDDEKLDKIISKTWII